MARKSAEFDLNKFTLVQNNTLHWLLLYNEAQNRKYPLLTRFGQTTRMRRSDVFDIMVSQRELFEMGYAVIVDDPDFVEYLDMSQIYKHIVKSFQEIDDLLSQKDEEIAEFYNNAPKGIRELLLRVCINKVEIGDKVIDSISKQRFLEGLFKRKLERE